MKTREELLEFDSETCEISLGGLVIAYWNDNSHSDCPEDLIWSREIGNLTNRCLFAGIRLERARAEKLPEHIKDTLRAAHDLCNLICGSSPSSMIKGEIESAAFELGHHSAILNAYHQQSKAEES